MWHWLYQIVACVGSTHADEMEAARRAFRCFARYGEDVQEYARATRWVDASCEDEVVDLLAAVRRAQSETPDGDPEAKFNADQNALVVKHAEEYYRTMVRGGPDSW